MDLFDLLDKWVLNVDSIEHSEMALFSLPGIVFDMGYNMMVHNATRCEKGKEIHGGHTSMLIVFCIISQPFWVSPMMKSPVW